MYLEQEAALLSKKYKNTQETKESKKHWKSTENLTIKQKHIIN